MIHKIAKNKYLLFEFQNILLTVRLIMHHLYKLFLKANYCKKNINSLWCKDIAELRLLGIVTYSRFFVSKLIWTNEVSFERAPKAELN